MPNAFIGKWKNNKKIIDIKNKGKTYMCSLDRANIGILFNNSLMISEYDDDVQVGGVGVYSPIGDGNSNYALWSSSKISGLLGSGIARKSDKSTNFIGEYLVTYFVGNNEGSTFTVKIVCTENKDVFTLLWYKENQKVLHGIGIMVDDSLAFAWGSIECKFDFDIFTLCGIEQTELKMQTVKWDDSNIHSCNFIRVL